MNWELFYLICFVVGFAFCAVSFVSGTMHLHLHVPKGVHLGTFHASGHASGTGHGSSHGTGHGHSTHGAHFSFVNPMTLAAFLTWFGGAGYLLVHFRHIWIFAGLLMAGLAGLAGAAIVFWFVGRVLMANERDLDPMDYEMVGVLGEVISTVREDGTGEIIFTQEGVRRPCAARSETGGRLAKGEEVVVTRYEHGIAYVRRWKDMAGPEAASLQQTAP